MNMIDSFLEWWQTSKIDNGGWQTIQVQAICSVKKMASDSDIQATYV